MSPGADTCELPPGVRHAYLNKGAPHLTLHTQQLGQWGEGRVEAVGAGWDEREVSGRGLSLCIVLRPYLCGIIDGRLDGAAARSTHGNVVS